MFGFPVTSGSKGRRVGLLDQDHPTVIFRLVTPVASSSVPFIPGMRWSVMMQAISGSRSMTSCVDIGVPEFPKSLNYSNILMSVLQNEKRPASSWDTSLYEKGRGYL